jgi:hypothetical protein
MRRYAATFTFIPMNIKLNEEASDCYNDNCASGFRRAANCG